MTANSTVKVQPFHDYPITEGIGYLGDGIRVDYPNEIVMYVERKNDITTNYYNFVGLSGAVPDGVSIDIVDPFTVFATEAPPIRSRLKLNRAYCWRAAGMWFTSTRKMPVVHLLRCCSWEVTARTASLAAR